MKRAAIIALLVLGAGFAAGLLHLFNLRFEAGDVYPAYSSLRADPLGARALHESLGDFVDVERHFEPLTRLGDGRNTTLLHLGDGPDSVRFTTNELRALDTFVRTGGRIIFAFAPVTAAPRVNRFAPPIPPPPVTATNRPPTGSPRGSRPSFNPMVDPGTTSIADHWSIDFRYAPLSRAHDGSLLPVSARRAPVSESKPTGEAPDESVRPTPNQTMPGVPDEWSIHTALYFRPTDSSWRVIAARHEGTNEYPVLVERPQGAGSIVLCADAYPFSNEALRSARQPKLLSWSIGQARRVIFEETHLGTSNDPGIAALARRYHLQGLAAALVVLAGLFIWRNSVSFVPPAEERLLSESTHQVAGKDSAQGFVHLLRRNVAPVDVLKICLEQWNQTTGGRKPSLAKLQAMQQLIETQNALEPHQRDPVNTYRQFCEILAKRT